MGRKPKWSCRIWPFHLKDVTAYSSSFTGLGMELVSPAAMLIAGSALSLKIMAVDLAENEQTKMISFNVAHAFVQPPPVISKEKESVSENILLIIVSAIIVAAIVITIAATITALTIINKMFSETAFFSLEITDGASTNA